MILIAPDKFKGTLTAKEVANIIADTLEKCGVTNSILTMPMADGGEGTAEALAAQPIEGQAGCYRLGSGRYVVVSSEIIGKTCFDFERESVLDRSSYAVGEAISRLMANDEAKRIYIAVGGTATSDGGTGMLQALGYTFINSRGETISEPLTPRRLGDICAVGAQNGDALLRKLAGLVDVEAGLYGGKISALTFARQKGATDADKQVIRQGLMNLARCASDSRRSAFDGAGGGIGFALATVIGCRCYLGGEFVVRRMHIGSRNVRLIISGEGSIDEQTEAGKVVKALENVADSYGIPFMAIGGRVDDGLIGDKYFSTMEPGELPPSSKAEAAMRLERTVSKIAPLIIRALENNCKKVGEKFG
jgi:glycerate kinase